MHSTATEVGTLVDGKNRLARILIKFDLQSERSRQDEGKCKGGARVEWHVRDYGCGKREPWNGNKDAEIRL